MRKTFPRIAPQEIAKVVGLDPEIIEDVYKMFLSVAEPEGESVVKKVYFQNEEPMILAITLATWIKSNNPQAKEPNMQKWAKEFDLMLTRDKRNFNQIKTIIEFSQKDSFWRSNILSPEKLRKQFDQLVVKSKNTKITIDDSLL